MSPQGRILFIDAYDSFSNNIIALLTSELEVTVESIKIDDPRFVLNNDAFFNFLHHFDAVVAGPGPGHPANPSDAGLISKLWTLSEERLLPVLGICFGFQSLALHHGATVARLLEPRHGMVAPILHCRSDIFAETGSLVATRYHSLHVTLGSDNTTRNSRNRWTPSRSCKELVPLAWDLSDVENGAVLMAVRHCHKPFWGVQYHPESICTNKEGGTLLSNWWREAVAWQSRRPAKRDSMEPELAPLLACESDIVASLMNKPDYPARAVRWRMLEVRNHDVIPDLVREVRAVGSDPIVLESGMRSGKPVNQETGRFSIMGLQDSSTLHIRYSTNNHRLDIVSDGNSISTKVGTISDVFRQLKAFVRQHAATGGAPAIPFWGGLVGYISYEAGLETINVSSSETSQDQPDIWFVFVERSIVVDHVDSKIYIQTLRAKDESWLDSVQERFQRINESYLKPPAENVTRCESTITSAPRSHAYQHKVRKCQEHLRAGSSYELCLTDTTRIHAATDSWTLYLRLRSMNPAPFGAYINLSSPTSSSNPTTSITTPQVISITSSSPERFLSWSRSGKCQFRPIKGTVKKTLDMNRTRAEELLNCPKERAENLMIVDLIRHDLNGAPGVRNVHVPKLMKVEEYETVFQLVSVIEGDLSITGEHGCSGVDVLASSLPPGSMTGAPKKRSCELLKEIEEQRPRGLYSGVLGYLDVGGGGDFSVVIRTAFKWDGEDEWRVGAGGAVTALSEPEGEWKEMKAKLESVLGTFGLGGL